MILNLDDPLDKDLAFATKNVQKNVDTVVKTSLAFGGSALPLFTKDMRRALSQDCDS